MFNFFDQDKNKNLRDSLSGGAQTFPYGEMPGHDLDVTTTRMGGQEVQQPEIQQPDLPGALDPVAVDKMTVATYGDWDENEVATVEEGVEVAMQQSGAATGNESADDIKKKMLALALAPEADAARKAGRLDTGQIIGFAMAALGSAMGGKQAMGIFQAGQKMKGDFDKKNAKKGTDANKVLLDLYKDDYKRARDQEDPKYGAELESAQRANRTGARDEKREAALGDPNSEQSVFARKTLSSLLGTELPDHLAANSPLMKDFTLSDILQHKMQQLQLSATQGNRAADQQYKKIMLEIQMMNARRQEEQLGMQRDTHAREMSQPNLTPAQKAAETEIGRETGKWLGGGRTTVTNSIANMEEVLGQMRRYAEQNPTDETSRLGTIIRGNLPESVQRAVAPEVSQMRSEIVRISTPLIKQITGDPNMTADQVNRTIDTFFDPTAPMEENVGKLQNYIDDAKSKVKDLDTRTGQINEGQVTGNPADTGATPPQSSPKLSNVRRVKLKNGQVWEVGDDPQGNTRKIRQVQ